MSHEHSTNKDSIWPIALNLTGACIISGLIIAGVYFFTADIAAQKKVELQNIAMCKLVAQAEKFAKVDGKPTWNAAVKGEKTIAYLVPAESKGYGGTLKMLVAVTPAGKVYNFSILESKETPGLGDKASQPKFQKQFIGKSTASLNVVKDPSNHQAIQAISGATISSKAVTAGVKEAVEQVECYLGGK